MNKTIKSQPRIHEYYLIIFFVVIFVFTDLKYFTLAYLTNPKYTFGEETYHSERGFDTLFFSSK